MGLIAHSKAINLARFSTARAISTSVAPTAFPAPPKRGPPRRRPASESWFEAHAVREAFYKEPAYADPLAPILSRPGPQDLSFLRPPPYHHVEQIVHDDRVSWSEWWKHWRASFNGDVNFYASGLARLRQNHAACLTLEQGHAWRNGDDIDLAVFYEGEPVDRNRKPLNYPYIDRRIFQLFVRTSRDWHYGTKSPVLLALAARIPFLRRFVTVPLICESPSDRRRRLDEVLRKYNAYRRADFKLVAKFLDIRSNLRTDAGVAEQHDIYRKRQRLWVQFAFYAHTNSLGRHSDGEMYHQGKILADQILIMRQGGFNKLTPEDIYDFCISCGSPVFLEHVHTDWGVDFPINEAMKKALVPVLEAHAKKLLDMDFPRMKTVFLYFAESSMRIWGPSPDRPTTLTPE
jgi:hypothetical protein